MADHGNGIHQMIRNRIRLDLDGFEDSKNNTGRKKKRYMHSTEVEAEEV